MQNLFQTIQTNQLHTLIKEQTTKLQICTNELELKEAESQIIRELLQQKHQKNQKLIVELQEVKLALRNTFTEANQIAKALQNQIEKFMRKESEYKEIILLKEENISQLGTNLAKIRAENKQLRHENTTMFHECSVAREQVLKTKSRVEEQSQYNQKSDKQIQKLKKQNSRLESCVTESNLSQQQVTELEEDHDLVLKELKHYIDDYSELKLKHDKLIKAQKVNKTLPKKVKILEEAIQQMKKELVIKTEALYQIETEKVKALQSSQKINMKLENDVKLLVNYLESGIERDFNFKPRNEHVKKLKTIVGKFVANDKQMRELFKENEVLLESQNDEIQKLNQQLTQSEEQVSKTLNAAEIVQQKVKDQVDEIIDKLEVEHKEKILELEQQIEEKGVEVREAVSQNEDMIEKLEEKDAYIVKILQESDEESAKLKEEFLQLMEQLAYKQKLFNGSKYVIAYLLQWIGAKDQQVIRLLTIKNLLARETHALYRSFPPKLTPIQRFRKIVITILFVQRLQKLKMRRRNDDGQRPPFRSPLIVDIDFIESIDCIMLQQNNEIEVTSKLLELQQYNCSFVTYKQLLKSQNQFNKRRQKYTQYKAIVGQMQKKINDLEEIQSIGLATEKEAKYQELLEEIESQLKQKCQELIKSEQLRIYTATQLEQVQLENQEYQKEFQVVKMETSRELSQRLEFLQQSKGYQLQNKENLLEEQLLEMEREATIKKNELRNISSSKKVLNFEDLSENQ